MAHRSVGHLRVPQTRPVKLLVTARQTATAGGEPDRCICVRVDLRSGVPERRLSEAVIEDPLRSSGCASYTCVRRDQIDSGYLRAVDVRNLPAVLPQHREHAARARPNRTAPRCAAEFRPPSRRAPDSSSGPAQSHRHRGGATRRPRSTRPAHHRQPAPRYPWPNATEASTALAFRTSVPNTPTGLHVAATRNGSSHRPPADRLTTALDGVADQPAASEWNPTPTRRQAGRRCTTPLAAVTADGEDRGYPLTRPRLARVGAVLVPAASILSATRARPASLVA